MLQALGLSGHYGQVGRSWTRDVKNDRIAVLGSFFLEAVVYLHRGLVQRAAQARLSAEADRKGWNPDPTSPCIDKSKYGYNV